MIRVVEVTKQEYPVVYFICLVSAVSGCVSASRRDNSVVIRRDICAIDGKLERPDG